MHPNGDYASALKSKLVLHYQMMTIVKGSTDSMFNYIRQRAPGIVLSDFISFNSLRSFGILNNKVVSDQVGRLDFCVHIDHC